MKDSVQSFWRAVVVSSFLGAMVFPWRSAAVNLLVYNTNDSGAGSLRQAIEDNRVLGGGNTIVFSNVVTGTITLTTGELLITNDVAIIGPGASVLAVNGNATNRVFDIGAVTTFISGLTVTNGHPTTGIAAGGGIFLYSGTLTVNNCTISGNSVPSGVYGGGICNAHGTLTVSNCTVTGNAAPYGAGIGNVSIGLGNVSLAVIGSTVSGNSASGGGGGIFNWGSSGPATLRVIASTLSSNSAGNYGGGIYNLGSTNAMLTVLASTLSGNTISVGVQGGGICNFGDYGSVVIGDTILKAGVSGPNLYSSSGAFISSEGYNLSSDDGGGYLTALGDRTNTDPMLGPLQDNGGPTPTMMPLPGSPAIDQGTNLAGLFTDQRGRCRTYDDPNILNAPAGDGTDIGAVEINPAHTTIVGTTNDNGVSMRWCACDAQPGDIITFAPSVTGTVTLAAGELLIPNKNVTILGPGANVLAVSGNSTGRVLHIYNSVVSISGLTIANGYAQGAVGGGIYNDHSTLTVSNCAVTGNSATNGGGIYNNAESGNATLTVIASDVSSNQATSLGGGIFNDANNGGFATLRLSACTLASNFVLSGSGGGIYNDGETGFAALIATNCTLAGNRSSEGGGIYNDGASSGGATVYLLASTLSGNFGTTYQGNGIFNYGGAASVEIGDTILDYTNVANIYNNGTVTSDGYNLSGANDSAVLNAATDQNSTAPMLGPLQDNGGPTPTMAPLPGSPAIDQGKSLGLTTDQRGRPRPYDNPAIPNAIGGDASDIGAVEIQSAESYPIFVTNTNDSGAGSLRQALAAAYPGSSVLFGSNVAGTITLTNGELVIDKNVAILGPGANVLAISGNKSSRVFDITNAFANISGLTLRDGTVLGFTGSPGQTVLGGGIYCEQAATLALSDCVISNCAAIGGNGRSVFTSGNGGNGGDAYGGGILAYGKLTLDRCLMINNEALGGSGGSGGTLAGQGGNGGAGYGGGIANYLSAILHGCTLSGNRATFGAGGGGHIPATNGTAWAAGFYDFFGGTLINCTIASNVVNGAGTGLGGGIYCDVSDTVLLSCTVAGNNADSSGGGLYILGGGPGMTNTIIADNTAANAPDVGNVRSFFTSGGYNLIGNTNGSSGFGATGDLLNVNPMLGPLQDNGGPTPTMALLADSPAIDHGNSFGLTTDQRGRPRPYDNPAIPNAIGGDGSDIGAVEIQSAESTSIIVTTTNDSGAGSLRQALSAAYPGSSVLFGSNVVGTITLTNGELVIGRNVAILGPGANVLAISGNNSSRVFDITNGFANISGLTIRDGTVLGLTGRPGQTVSGGGIFCEQTATLAMSDCVISNCAAIGGHGANVFTSGNGGNGGVGYGGGICNVGKMTLDRCLMINNEALGGSGGSGGILAGNQGGNGGWGIGGGVANNANFSPSVMLRGCTLSGNRATFGAGGGGHMVGTNGYAWGGGFYDFFGTTLINCTIASNVVNGAGAGLGGGIYVDFSDTALLSCTVAGDNADSSGGGIYGSTPRMTNTIIADNTAASFPDVSGFFTSGGYNLFGNTNGSYPSSYGATNDLLNVNPLLGALQDNGGPTPTMALLTGSLAIDQGKSFGLTTDQRGSPRPFDFPSIPNASGGDGSDIGAFEVGQPQLSIQAIGNAAILSWPNYYANFSLQTNGSVTAPAGWANAPGIPAVTGTQYFLTNSALPAKTFFRLRSN